MSRLLRAAMLPPPAPAPATTFPNAGNTGANLAGFNLVSVPSQATSGPGWSWNSGSNYVYISGTSCTFSGYTIPTGGIYVHGANSLIENCYVGGSFGIYGSTPANYTTVNNCQLVIPGGGTGCVLFEAGPSYNTVSNCTLSGTNQGAGRMSSGIVCNNADPLFTMFGNNIFWVKNAFENAQAPTGVCTVDMYGNYVHDLGFVALDHTDCIYMSYGLGGNIYGNTLFNQLAESDIVDPTAMNPTPLAITGNLMGGAGYVVYGGTPTDHVSYSGPAQFFTFTGNYFTTQFFPNGGYYGPIGNWGVGQNGGTNVWADNYWYDGPLAGQLVPSVEAFTYQTPPAVPASGTPLANPFGVPCTVVVTAPAGCTLTGVSSTPQTVLIPPAGATSQIMIPGATMTAAASVTLTYTGTAPTWTWTA